MEVMSGYQNTDVGVIPSDWNVRSIKEIGPLQRGFDLLTTEIRSGLVPVVYSNGVMNYHDKFMVRGPGVITGRSGTLGKVHFVESDFWPHNTSLWVTAFKGNNEKYIYYLYDYLNFNRFASGSGVPTLNRNDAHEFRLGIPSLLNEQRLIAAVLSDVDSLLDSLDRLIAKKRDLKQAAMQKLLTGQMRLPGFNGDWGIRALKDICWFQEGPGVRATQFKSSGIKLLNGTNINCGVLNLETTTRFIAEYEGRGAYAHFLADEGDIVIASSGVTINRLHEKVAFVRAQDLPFCMNTSTIRFKPFAGKLSPNFLFQFLTGNDFKKMVGDMATGSAQLNFGPSHIQKIDLILPPLPEQIAISKVLAEMDEEIKVFELRREKTALLKQGMMQELLTGRTRLV